MRRPRNGEEVLVSTSGSRFGLGRRRFLGRGLLGAAALFGRRALAAPAIVTPEGARPATSWGTAIGDVTHGRAVLWSRTDRPARLIVEYGTTESLSDARRIVGPAALETTDFTARVDLHDVPDGRRLFYRASFQDLSDLRTFSAPVGGSFLTAPAGRRDVSFAWGADTVGQGWGIDLARGGMRTYEAIRAQRPDFFVHTGDTIYADNPIASEVRLDDGTVWKNVVTEAKSKVAETLDEFRGNYLYNLLDENVRRFNAEVPQVVQWDDHEVLNNWYPTEVLDDPRYRVKSVALLAARAKRAFLEYAPLRHDAQDPERIFRAVPYGPLLELFVVDLRSDRGPNSPNRQAAAGEASAFFGETQVRWLRERLLRSTATWKVVACDMPLGLAIRDGEADFEGLSNADPGPPLGRELELASLLQSLHEGGVRNVVWITGDVHYAAAHHYDPARARFTEFTPFWEFVAGPLHAGTFGPNDLDPTFGPEARFVAVPKGMKPNRPPSEGLQFFGTVRIDGRSEVMTVALHDRDGKTLYRVELTPAS
jgi:alkaline phosphatase D